MARVETRAGAKMSVNTAKMVEKQVYYWGEWEPHFTRYVEDLPWQDGIFLDLGANIGYFSILAAGHFKQVIAVEASPSIAKRLQDNINDNNCRNVVVRNVAVGGMTGEANFFFNQNQSGGSSLLPGTGRELEAKVPMRPLNEILTEEEIRQLSFVKVDLEGFEHVAMQQILDMVDELREKIEIVVEFDPERDQRLWDIVDRFLKRGFRAFILQKSYDIREYSDSFSRSALLEISKNPDIFCDIILRRS